jgi:NAD(P)-dependent dehydrogenase (short-subunit alcohol dehydrogenase family)
VFKDPVLSILQIGGSEQGITDSLISTFEAKKCGQRLTVRILVMESAEETVTRIRGKYGPKGLLFDSIHLDVTKSLSSQLRQGDIFDVLLVTSDRVLDGESKEALLRDAQSMLKPGGISVVMDQRGEEEKYVNSSPYGHILSSSSGFADFHSSSVLPDNVDGHSPENSRTWNRLTLQDSSSEREAIISRQNTDPVRTADPVCILRLQSCGEKTMSVVEALAKSLRAHNIEVTICAWPPKVEDVESRFVISLLDMDCPFLSDIDTADFDLVRQVALLSARLLWVCPNGDPHMAVSIGWLRVLQNENDDRYYQHLTLDGTEDVTALYRAIAITKVAMAQTEEREFVEQHGLLNIPRWSYDQKMTRTIADSRVSLEFDTMKLGDMTPLAPLKMVHEGDHENAHFVRDVHHNPYLATDEVEVELKFVVVADHHTQEPGTPTIWEASGVIKATGSSDSLLRPKDHVCLKFSGDLSTSVVLKEELCQKVPSGVKMNEAACIPMTFATALRALIDVAGLRHHQTILVQAGGTRIGRAVVLLAIASDAVVYATARDSEETKTLEGLGMPRENILRDCDPLLPAVTGVLTGKQGWDVIIRTVKTNDTACPLPRCIAEHGAMIDLYLEDPLSIRHTHLRMEKFTPQLSELARSFDVFPSAAVVDALERHRINGAYRGVMISFDQEDRVRVAPNVRNTMQLYKGATYLLAGGLGGLGRSLARLLVDCGARNLAFLSRAGPNSPAAKALAKEMASVGVTARTFQCDISEAQSLAAALAECTREMPPIRGIIQLAAVIWDGIFANYTCHQWRENLRPKVEGSLNLHDQLPEDMDFFVMLSSIAGLVGHQGQAGYAAGNTFQDSLASYRRKKGRPAVTIDLGAMLDVGMIKDGMAKANFSTSDAVWMTEAQLWEIMTMCILGKIDEYAIPCQVCTGLPSGGMLQLGQLEVPLHLERPFFAALKHFGTTARTKTDALVSVDPTAEYIRRLKTVISLDDARIFTTNLLLARLAERLGRGVDDIDVAQPLHIYGIDSLMAVELRSWIHKKMVANVSLFDVLNDSIDELASKIAKSSELVPPEALYAA